MCKRYRKTFNYGTGPLNAALIWFAMAEPMVISGNITRDQSMAPRESMHLEVHTADHSALLCAQLHGGAVCNRATLVMHCSQASLIP